MDDETLDCGHQPVTVPGSMGTGYGTDADGKRYCYRCCERQEIASLKTADHTIGYFSMDGKTVTTWTGAKLMSITESWTGNRRWSKYGGFVSRRYIRAIDAHGNRWYGSGPNENGTYVRLHKNKGK